MKTKSKIILTSICSILLCASLAIGATFALFTSESRTNIAVTSGKVKVDASFEIDNLYSIKPDANGTIVDENGEKYIHEVQVGDSWSNGGSVEIDGAELKLDKITAGDKVDLKLNVANEGNVSTLYRVKAVLAEGEELGKELQYTFNEIDYVGLKSYTGEWKVITDDVVVPLSIQLPATSTLQDKSCKIVITVEAVQGNASIKDEASIEFIQLKNVSVKKEVVADEETVLDAGFTNVTVPSDVATAGDILTLKVEEKEEVPSVITIVTGAGSTVYDISVVNQDGVKIADDGGNIKVKIYVGEAEATAVTHVKNGEAIDVPFTYDGEFICFETDSFSPYVVKSKYVAKIDDVKYEDLQSALDAAKTADNKVVTVISDVNYFDCETTPLKFIAENEDIVATLDLNGHTVSATLNNGKSIALLQIGQLNKPNATLTIEDSSNGKGTMTIAPTKYSDAWSIAVETIYVYSSGRLTLNGGNIITKGVEGGVNADNPYGIFVQTNSNAQTAELTINGGYVESKSTTGMAVRVASFSENGAVKFTLNDGVIVGAEDGRGIWLSQHGTHGLIECTINGGTIIGDRSLEVGDFNTSTDESDNIKVVVNGGNFVFTNNRECLVHPDCDVLHTSKGSGYNEIFSHVSVTDNRN